MPSQSKSKSKPNPPRASTKSMTTSSSTCTSMPFTMKEPPAEQQQQPQPQQPSVIIPTIQAATPTTKKASTTRRSNGISNHNARIRFPPPPPPKSSNKTLSIESLVSVPLRFVLRQQTNHHHHHQNEPTPNRNHNHKRKRSLPPTTNTTTNNHNDNNNQTHNLLLSRAEATILLQTTQLAHELDTLTSMTIRALRNARVVRELQSSLPPPPPPSSSQSQYQSQSQAYTTTTTHTSTVVPTTTTTPILRAMEPLLHLHGRIVPNRVLRHVQTSTERILGSELPSLARTLRQFAEQNWSVADTLEQTMGEEDGSSSEDEDEDENGGGTGTEEDGDGDGGTVGRLVREKKAVAKMEEEVCRRIDGLVRMGMAGGCGVTSPKTKKRNEEEDHEKDEEDEENDDDDDDGDNDDDDEEEEDETGDLFDTAIDEKTGAFVSMDEFCCRVFRTTPSSTAMVSYEHNGGGGDKGSGGGRAVTPNDIQTTHESPSYVPSRTNPTIEPKKRKDMAAAYPSPVPSSRSKDTPTATTAKTAKTAKTKTTDGIVYKTDENDDDYNNERATQAPAPIPFPTSNSLDDAATALNLLSEAVELGSSTTAKG